MGEKISSATGDGRGPAHPVFQNANGSTVDEDGIVTLPEVTIVGDASQSDSSRTERGDTPLQDDVVGNILPGLILGGAIGGLAEGAVGVGKAALDEVGAQAVHGLVGAAETFIDPPAADALPRGESDAGAENASSTAPCTWPSSPA